MQQSPFVPQWWGIIIQSWTVWFVSERRIGIAPSSCCHNFANLCQWWPTITIIITNCLSPLETHLWTWPEFSECILAVYLQIVVSNYNRKAGHSIPSHRFFLAKDISLFDSSVGAPQRISRPSETPPIPLDSYQTQKEKNRDTHTCTVPSRSFHFRRVSNDDNLVRRGTLSVHFFASTLLSFVRALEQSCHVRLGIGASHAHSVASCMEGRPWGSKCSKRFKCFKCFKWPDFLLTFYGRWTTRRKLNKFGWVCRQQQHFTTAIRHGHIRTIRLAPQVPKVEVYYTTLLLLIIVVAALYRFRFWWGSAA